jgi:hypothetical protein
LRQELFKNIVAGTNSIDVEKAIRDFISGQGDKAGNLKRYVTQVSRDALNQYDGTINSRIAEEFGLDAFQYVGSLIEDSRPQCVRWTGKGVILKDQLEKEIGWAFTNGSGMIPGTNSENFAVFRGGYNCRHSAIPFKLTKRERERLEGKEEKPVEVPEESKINPDKIQDNPQKSALKPLSETDINLTYGKTNPELIPESLRNNKELLSRLPDQIFILSDNGKANVTGGNSFYMPSAKEVTVGLKSQRYKDSYFSQAKVTIHEFAHRTHYERKLIDAFNIEENTKKAFNESKSIVSKRLRAEKSFKDFNYTYRQKIEDYSKKYEGVFSKSEIQEMFIGYADTLQALTSSRIGFGHTKVYMKRYNGGVKEWFAHASENYFQGNVVFQEEFAELFDQMNDYFSKEVIKKNL